MPAAQNPCAVVAESAGARIADVTTGETDAATVIRATALISGVGASKFARNFVAVQAASFTKAEGGKHGLHFLRVQVATVVEVERFKHGLQAAFVGGVNINFRANVGAAS